MTITVTSSWDDGHALDLSLAEHLDRYGLAATFYIAPASLELAPANRLSRDQIRDLASRFEIGGHTYTHRSLPSLRAAVAEAEIAQGKEFLEDAIQVPVNAFCYPRGAYTPQHVRMVRDAGFSYARTTRRYVTQPSSDALQAGTTVQAYWNVFDWRGLARRLGATRRIFNTVYCHLNWDDLAIRLFDELLDADHPSSHSIFHLWGHSWEIDSNGDWRRLHRVLEHVGQRPEVRYVSNSLCEAA